jgi:hypothetical protein
VVFLIRNVRGDIGMNEITISKNTLFTWLLVIILLLRLRFGIYVSGDFYPAGGSTTTCCCFLPLQDREISSSKQLLWQVRRLFLHVDSEA